MEHHHVYTFFNGNINYFDWAIFSIANCKKLLEGTSISERDPSKLNIQPQSPEIQGDVMFFFIAGYQIFDECRNILPPKIQRYQHAQHAVKDRAQHFKELSSLGCNLNPSPK